MNWETIKHIYCRVLIYKNKIEYLGEDRYKTIDFYSTGEKLWEREYQNGQLHGKDTRWDESGKKLWEHDYQNGKRIT